MEAGTAKKLRPLLYTAIKREKPPRCTRKLYYGITWALPLKDSHYFLDFAPCSYHVNFTVVRFGLPIILLIMRSIIGSGRRSVKKFKHCWSCVVDLGHCPFPSLTPSKSPGIDTGKWSFQPITNLLQNQVNDYNRDVILNVDVYGDGDEARARRLSGMPIWLIKRSA